LTAAAVVKRACQARRGDGILVTPGSVGRTGRYGRRLRLAGCRNAADLRALAGLAESGAIRPAIDRTYPLAGGGEAIRQIAGAHATGKGVVVI
jgi:NADPH:quinone reductase-like Zn-dependent oxidoreductase